MKDYIEKVKKNYLEIRKFNRRNTSVHNKKTKLIKKSLLYNGENIKEEGMYEEGENNFEGEGEQGEYFEEYVEEIHNEEHKEEGEEH